MSDRLRTHDGICLSHAIMSFYSGQSGGSTIMATPSSDCDEHGGLDIVVAICHLHLEACSRQTCKSIISVASVNIVSRIVLHSVEGCANTSFDTGGLRSLSHTLALSLSLSLSASSSEDIMRSSFSNQILSTSDRIQKHTADPKTNQCVPLQSKPFNFRPGQNAQLSLPSL